MWEAREISWEISDENRWKLKEIGKLVNKLQKAATKSSTKLASELVTYREWDTLLARDELSCAKCE
jgi:hypothetical protein